MKQRRKTAPRPGPATAQRAAAAARSRAQPAADASGQDRTQGLTLLRRSRTQYPTEPQAARLESFTNRFVHRDYWIEFDCPEFTALCPVTGQPDFGHLTIRYVPDRLCLESKSLKLYLFAYRQHRTFHEDVVNRVLDDVVAAVHPRRATVLGRFNARGGIAIRVEASYPDENTR